MAGKPFPGRAALLLQQDWALHHPAPPSSGLGWHLVQNWGKTRNKLEKYGMHGHFNPKCPIFISLFNTCNCPNQVNEQPRDWSRQSRSGFLRQLLHDHLFCSFSCMELKILDLVTTVRHFLGILFISNGPHWYL